MGDTLDFPAFPGQPELDGMDRAQLLSCLERIQLVLEQLDELEPEDMDSDAYEDWGERHVNGLRHPGPASVGEDDVQFGKRL
ncbi:hypothetical protein, partial [Flavonifractor plautii]|uniref:hypothetical protein n=1 Tax=Flavonifractor plautii TaxID=292800 RepID=UPI0018A96D89